MKRMKIASLLLASIAMIVFACTKDEPSYLTSDWKQSIITKATPKSTDRNFLSEVNLSTNERTWSEDTREINFDIDWNGISENPVSKVDIYVAVQEKIGTGVNLAGGVNGKMLTSVSSVPDDGKFILKVTVDDIYNVLKSEFKNTTRPNKLDPNDLVEIKWVITGKDGQIVDSRNGKDCFGEFCSYGFGVTSVADVWSGTYEYEYFEVGAGIQCCINASIPKITVGTKGTVTITKVGNGQYMIPDAEFGGSWNGAPVSETLSFNFNTGIQSLTDTKAHAVKWTFSNNKGKTIDLRWANKWEVSYKEWGKIRLTRKDAINWPTNLK